MPGPTSIELVLRQADPKWPEPPGRGTVGSTTSVAVVGSTLKMHD